MARSYAPLLTSTWADPDFRALSAVAQRVYLLALSQPNMTYAGVVPYTSRRWARMANDTKPADVDQAIDELAAARFVILDDETEEIFIRSFVKHNGVLAQPQLRKAMQRAFREILSAAIRQAFLDELPDSERTLLAPCPKPASRVPEGSPAGPGQEPSSSPRPEPEPSSSSSPPLADDDDDERLASAYLILADKVLKLRTVEKGPVGNPDAWVARVAKQRRQKHEPIARAHLADEPSMTALELATALEPELFPPPPRRPRPPCDLCAGATWIPDEADPSTVRPCPTCRPPEENRP